MLSCSVSSLCRVLSCNKVSNKTPHQLEHICYLNSFRDGEQLVNRIPNCSLLTNKLGLFNSLSEYSRVMGALKGDRCRMKMTDFVPETYRIDQIKDREQFLDIYKGTCTIYEISDMSYIDT